MSEVQDALTKKFGRVFTSGDSILDKKSQIIPVSPAMDMILGGGIPEGSFVVVTGPFKAGKTVLCLTFAANCQKPEFGGRKVYFLNIEGRIKSRDLSGIHGLQTDPDKFEVIGSTEDNIIYAEEYMDIFNTLVAHEKKAVFILDSVSQLCSRARLKNETGKSFRDDVPKLLADMTKRVANILPVNDNIVMCVTHRIANQSGMGRSQYTEASGNKVQYQADVKLGVKWFEAYKVGEDQVGQIGHWQCDTSAIGPPGLKCESLLRYGYGIDDRYELLNLCKDFGFIQQKGSWITFDEENKAQGMEKACDYLLEHPELYKSLEQKVNEVLYNV
jgi:recombination protein RecA